MRDQHRDGIPKSKHEDGHFRNSGGLSSEESRWKIGSFQLQHWLHFFLTEGSHHYTGSLLSLFLVRPPLAYCMFHPRVASVIHGMHALPHT